MSNPEYEDVIKLVTVDKHRKKRITVKIVDKDGDEVPFKDTIKQVMKYLEDKLAPGSNDDGANHVLGQVLPLMHQSMCVALPQLVGANSASAILALESIRFPMSVMMLLSFSLLKLIQQKEFKIVTVEEDISEEEWDKMERFHKVTSTAMLGALAGVPPKEIIKEMMKRGYITEAEVAELTSKDIDEE